ncbi:unnamed protein product [Heterobilharzia americana]|nr:unnamed protein product [Heterobilharzia americana]
MNNSDKFISQSNTNCEADGTSNHVINNSVCGNSSIKSITSSPLRSSVREPIDHHNTSNGVSFSYLNYPNTNQCRNSRTISKYFRQNQLVNSIKKSLNNSCSSCYLSHNFCATDNKSSYRSMKCDISSSSRNYAAYSEKLESNNRFFDNNKNTTTNIASSKSNNYSTIANYSNCITNSASNLFIDDIHNISPGATDVAAAAVAATSAVSTDMNSTNFTRMNNSVEQNFLNYFRHHSSRASPVTVQWLLENYESADGVSLLRSGLYSHYLTHCLQNWLEPMNPASFGKLIRSIFVGLRTRRLGTR